MLKTKWGYIPKPVGSIKVQQSDKIAYLSKGKMVVRPMSLVSLPRPSSAKLADMFQQNEIMSPHFFFPFTPGGVDKTR